VTNAVSDASGNIAANYTPKWNRRYRWLFQSPTYGPSYSATTTVTVQSLVRASLTRTSAPLGTTVKAYGSVSPPKDGATVYLDRYVSGKWVRLRTATLAPHRSTASKYSFALRLPRGTYTLRVRKKDDAKNIGAVSSTLRLRVT
jgi:hypothetical protein